MSNNPPTAPVACPVCAEPLPPGAPVGHCPRCLIRVSLESQGAATAETDDPRLILGDHELYEEIARGGMGIVYRARQRRLGREVAVKVLRGSEFASAEAQQRFRSEAAAVARLNHPGIVGIHDFGEQDGVLWFSMELLPGKNLADRVSEHPLPARTAAECVCRVAEAVQHAHDQGVLHRDLKPSNILLTADGQPRVTDFGLARRIATETADTAAELTHTGQRLGSPGYAAPEQALDGKADVRTDVYGLGALLYHLLTGRPPFQGPTLDSILLQLRDADPIPPGRLNPTVPRDLETICLKCLDRNPARRYATARATAEDLARFLAGAPIVARPRTWVENGAHWLRRHWLLATAAVITATSLLASTVISRREMSRARASESEARRIVYLRDISRAQTELRQHSRSGVELLERHLAPRDGATDLRGWEWHYLRSHAAAAEPIEGGEFDLYVSMAPDGRHFAQGGQHGGIKIWDTATRHVIRRLPAGNRPITSVQWLADNRRIVSCSYDADVRMHDAIEGALLLEFPAIHRPVFEIVWSPDGVWFAHADWQGEVIVRAARGDIVRRILVPQGETHLAWHPRQSFLAIYGPELRAVRVCEVATNRPPSDWPVPRAVTALAWSPDGTHLALAEEDASLRLVTADTEMHVVWQRTLPPDGLSALQFTRNGTQLVLANGNGSIAFLRAEDGADRDTLIAHSPPGIASLSVADRFGVSLGKVGDLRLWEVPNAAAATLRVEGAVKNLAWSGDGRFLHVIAVQPPPSASDTWRWRHPVWERATGRWLDAQAGSHAEMSEWSRDGRLLARVVEEGGHSFVTVEEFSTGKRTHRFAVDSPVSSLNWDAAGTRLAASCPFNGADRHIVLCDLASGRTTVLPACAHVIEAPEVGEPVEWNPDARTLLVCDRAWHYDVQTALPVTGWPDYESAGGPLAILALAWHPRGGEIAVGRETGIVELRSSTDGHLLRQRTLHGAKLRAVSWHPTERRLASAGSDGVVKVLDADTLDELLVFPNAQPDVRALAWSHDGRILASGAADGTILLRSSGVTASGY